MRYSWIFVFLLLFSYSSDIFAVTGGLSQSEVTATTSSTKVLDTKPLRNYLLIVNKGAATVYVKFGSASTGTEGIPVVSGGNYEPFNAPIDSIFIKASTGTQAVLIIEGNVQ